MPIHSRHNPRSITRLLVILLVAADPSAFGHSEAKSKALSQLRSAEEAYANADYTLSESFFSKAMQTSRENSILNLELLSHAGLVRTCTKEKKFEIAESMCAKKTNQGSTKVSQSSALFSEGAVQSRYGTNR